MSLTVESDQMEDFKKMRKEILEHIFRNAWVAGWRSGLHEGKTGEEVDGAEEIERAFSAFLAANDSLMEYVDINNCPPF